MDQDKLLNSIMATTHASRPQVAIYLKLICKEAQALDRKSMFKRSGNGEYREPLAPGEKIAGHIHHVLLQQEYVNPKDDSELDEIQDLSYVLMTNPERHELWQELFDRIEKLSQQK